MRTKARSCNNKIGRHQTTQNRVMPPKYLEVWGILQRWRQHNICSRQGHSSWNPQSVYHHTGTSKQRVRSTRCHTIIETSLDITYVDRTKSSLRADVQPPLADLTQLALGSAKSWHPPKSDTQMCTLQTVSTRSFGHYAWGCISDILSPEDNWGYGFDPSNLRLCDAGGQSIGFAKKHQHDKGILKTHITAQHTVT
jgi:hypothetical protein